ncbi:hypothetical protein H310_05857 [Aphanomyces invadans]|uniref:Uncharacterized protein n=1 Tax=Aphanomyces invadans TaxID=157072 RepID=A0A024U7X1_9STRA|nr:hypothetical protein H310_05857 [Aphanomyces invadans]ETW02310.1 hypothetical protein H310_05857 [Aphanomyces invadans]|eukprot:XP_008868915.1 hypothetical protein H310_05857 [Aphanomyces invadans]
MDEGAPHDTALTVDDSTDNKSEVTDSEACVSLHELLAVREPSAPVVDHSSLRALFDVDVTFQSKVTALGHRSAHAASLNEVCANRAESLNWSVTRVGAVEIAALAVYVSFTNRNLIVLNLSGNQIGPIGCAMLGKALLTNNTLEVLDLSCCDLTGSPFRPNYDGVMALVKGLESKRSMLLHLNVANTALLPTGVRLISTSVAFHPSLTSLNISNNQAGLFRDKQGYLGIANLLRYSPRLTSLDMALNPLERNARPALVDALQANCTLTTLNVARCALGKLDWSDQTTYQQLRVLE